MSARHRVVIIGGGFNVRHCLGPRQQATNAHIRLPQTGH